MRKLSFASLVAVAWSITSCALRFEIAPDAPHGRIVRERKTFVLWGLAPTHSRRVVDQCPAGAAAIAEEITTADALLTAATIGLYAPRSTTYFCRQ